MTKNELKELIHESFPVSSPPISDELLYRSTCLHDECLYIKEVFSNKRWDEVKIAEGDERYRDDILHFFSTAAFLYYFPTFMIAIIDQYEKSDVFVDALLDFISSRIKVPEIDDLLVQELFKTEKRYVVLNFLQHLWSVHVKWSNRFVQPS